MGQEARTEVNIRDFPGQVSDADPHDLPPGGAQEQVNATSAHAAQVRVRGGFLDVSFEED